MKQKPFAYAEYTGKRKQTRKTEINRVAEEGFGCPDRTALSEG